MLVLQGASEMSTDNSHLGKPTNKRSEEDRGVMLPRFSRFGLACTQILLLLMLASVVVATIEGRLGFWDIVLVVIVVVVMERLARGKDSGLSQLLGMLLRSRMGGRSSD
jgi:hypothetical protein